MSIKAALILENFWRYCEKIYCDLLFVICFNVSCEFILAYRVTFILPTLYYQITFTFCIYHLH